MSSVLWNIRITTPVITPNHCSQVARDEEKKNYAHFTRYYDNVVTVGFCCDADEICDILRYYAAQSGLYRTWVSVPISCPETSVRNYLSTLRNIAEERRCHNDLCSGDSRYRVRILIMSQFGRPGFDSWQWQRLFCLLRWTPASYRMKIRAQFSG